MANGSRGDGSVFPVDPGEIGAAYGALRSGALEAAERIGRELELERRMHENPLAVLGVAAGAGFVLGGGLWPLVWPFMKATVRSALRPANLLAIAVAIGAARAAERAEDQERAPSD